MGGSDSAQINHRLRQERISRNWHQQDVADELGTTVVTVNRWERGVQQPSAYFRIKLCALFSKSAEELGLLPEVASPQTSVETEVPPSPEPPSPRPESPDDATDVLPSLIERFPESPPRQLILRPAPRSYQNRARMLRRLYRTYSELLKHSLQDVVKLELELAHLPDAVQNAKNLLLHMNDQTPQLLPTETSLLQVYDESEYELLILGAPGSGKSMLLLELAKHLVERAQEEETHPLPFIFPLSSWAQTRPPLDEWLITQLVQIYDLPRPLARRWVRKEQIILPLLDGLDEMETAARPACIAAINAYHRTYLAPLAVCSRHTEYEEATRSERLHLQNALLVQPLTQEQVQDYLVSIGAQATELRVALLHDVDLQELATTPLMLHVLTLAYRGTPLYEVASLETLLAKQRQIFASYVRRMLTRQRNRARTSPQQTVYWLTCLAQQMRKHNQTIIYLEALQPDWLAPKSQRSYAWLGVRLPGILIGILTTISLFMFMDTILESALDISTWITIGLGGLGGLLGILFHGSALSHSSRSKEQASHAGPHNYTRQRKRYMFFAHKIFGIPIELIAVGVGFIVGLGINYNGGLAFGLSAGLSIGLSCVLVSLLPNVEDIQLTERLHWTWGSLIRSLFAPVHMVVTLALIILVTIIVGLSYWFLASQPPNNYTIMEGLSLGLNVGLSVGLGIGLSYWLLAGLVQGISSERIEEEQRQIPGKGIQDSLRSGILMGIIGLGMLWLISSLSYGLSTWLYWAYDSGPISGFYHWLNNDWSLQVLPWTISWGWVVGLCGGLVVCLVSGGLAAWRHGLVRLHLQRSGMLPLRCVRFFDEATSCILLRKVGGGYSFIHRLLLDYFAENP